MEFSFLEFLGVLFGIGGVWLTVKEKIWCWPVGLINVTIYIFIFYEARLYADMGLQGFYVVLSFYGWHQWLRGGNKGDPLPVTRIGIKTVLFLVGTGIVSTFLMGWTLAHKTNADLPFWDSTTTVLSLIAEWMMARKYLECWLVWVFVDLMFIAIYTYKKLIPTTLLYGIFVLLAVTGFFAWKRSWERESGLKAVS